MTESFDAVLALFRSSLSKGTPIQSRIWADELAAAHAAELGERQAAFDAAEQDARRFDFVLEQLGADEAAALFCNKDMTAEEVRAAIDACMGEPASG
jgi:hypothetical protein